MAQSFAWHGACRARTILIVVSAVLGTLVLGSSLFHFGSSLRTANGCPECTCKQHIDLADLPTVDCGKDDYEMREELDKSVMQLLREELELQATVAEEAQQRAELAFLDAKKTASQFQKDAEKCNAGMEMSEEARAKAEAKYADARRDAEIWEKRARDLGWLRKDTDARRTNENEDRSDVKDGDEIDKEREEMTFARSDREDLGSKRENSGERMTFARSDREDHGSKRENSGERKEGMEDRQSETTSDPFD